MRLSRYFLPLLKETPADATIVSHRLMLRSGMVRQLAAGIYNWLPLGLSVLQRIEHIVREEMNRAGAIEILMPTLQPAELWEESGRYNDYGKEMLRISDRSERPLVYGPTNEEVVTDIFRQNVKSYKDLPLNLYQIQWKFRDEIRPRFGVMRGREFCMKDAYSFDIDFESSKQAYENMVSAYNRAFRRMGLVAIPVRADSGAIGGSLSHEFQVLADTGESTIYYQEELESLLQEPNVDIHQLQQWYAASDELHRPENCPVPTHKLKQKHGIEVGHVFHFGTKYSAPLKAYVTDKEGNQVLAQMGSYGIGISRLVGAIIEAHHDENGIIWPEAVAPFHIGLISLRPGDEACDALCEDLYQKFTSHSIPVLYHDTKESAGAKFATFDLIGIPWHIIVGPRGVKEGKVEIKHRRTGEKQELSVEAALGKFTQRQG